MFYDVFAVHKKSRDLVSLEVPKTIIGQDWRYRRIYRWPRTTIIFKIQWNVLQCDGDHRSNLKYFKWNRGELAFLNTKKKVLSPNKKCSMFHFWNQNYNSNHQQSTAMKWKSLEMGECMKWVEKWKEEKKNLKTFKDNSKWRAFQFFDFFSPSATFLSFTQQLTLTFICAILNIIRAFNIENICIADNSESRASEI